ncbi:M48 family metalloprotease [Nocardia sp. NBC_01377]|uniref:M48 family metalloprotease n=1 Tax=Nocardia sp. NBC_01377 TaxID=2903595 RepID=UPI00386A5F1B
MRGGWRRGSPTRSQLTSLIDQLALPQDWTVEDLFACLVTVRGRPIVRLPLPEDAPVGLCGLWLARSEDDVVLHRPSPDPMMERHVLAHEAAHMLLDHGRDSTPQELAGLLVDWTFGGRLDSVVSQVRTARGASTTGAYSRRDEYEAELLATMIMTRASQDGTLRRDRELRLL